MKNTLLLTVCAAALTSGLAHAQQPRSGANLNAPDAPGPMAKKGEPLPGEPAAPEPGSYGYDAKTGKFKSPDITPDAYGAHPVPGSL
ncbi:MAG: hypothetical protein ACEQSK_17000, partial [Sphingomonadaceae bacterium]